MARKMPLQIDYSISHCTFAEKIKQYKSLSWYTFENYWEYAGAKWFNHFNFFAIYFVFQIVYDIKVSQINIISYPVTSINSLFTI